MPTKPIDYSSVCFYKLCCNDPVITDIYIGHTTNFTRRKSEHKSRCNNVTSRDYSIYVYQFIRYHGGFDNWSMIELCTTQCENKRDAERIERQYIEDVGATLNRLIPTRTYKEYTVDNKNRIKKTRKQYQEDHKEELSKKNKQYREDHKEELLEYMKQYYKDHKEESKVSDKIRYENNKEEILKKNKQYREDHKEEISNQKKQYYKDHKEEISYKRKQQILLKK